MRTRVAQLGSAASTLEPMGVESFRAVGEAADDILMGAIAERWRIMLQENAAVAGGVGFSPASDAAALRRLIRSRNTGNVPADTITRMWRALSGDMMVARGLKAVHVSGGDVGVLLQGARGYFGFGANIQIATEIREALEKADQTPGVLACVPWPEHAGAGQWWPILNENRFRNLVIVAGWPSKPGSPSIPRRVREPRSVTENVLAPITTSSQIRTGSTVAPVPIDTRFPMTVDLHRLLSPRAGPPMENVSFTNMAPCEMKQSSPIVTSSQMKACD